MYDLPRELAHIARFGVEANSGMPPSTEIQVSFSLWLGAPLPKDGVPLTDVVVMTMGANDGVRFCTQWVKGSIAVFRYWNCFEELSQCGVSIRCLK
jgi:hypothetical protein